uniref:Uncharacterized protein n=1 Tax=Anguilla anguilla TaxID=7936 RepID=A0A0E9TGD5_ANGAN
MKDTPPLLFPTFIQYGYRKTRTRVHVCVVCVCELKRLKHALEYLQQSHLHWKS